jgi:hypothetical protein
MVHSQRLVPGKVFCCITSTTKHASNFRRQHYFVDTTEDKMRCARDETVPKVAVEVSGTCVSLLVPVRGRSVEAHGLVGHGHSTLTRTACHTIGRCNCFQSMESDSDLSQEVSSQPYTMQH